MDANEGFEILDKGSIPNVCQITDTNLRQVVYFVSKPREWPPPLLEKKSNVLLTRSSSVVYIEQHIVNTRTRISLIPSTSQLNEPLESIKFYTLKK